jgi:hypothetical protein
MAIKYETKTRRETKKTRGWGIININNITSVTHKKQKKRTRSNKYNYFYFTEIIKTICSCFALENIFCIQYCISEGTKNPV